MKSYVQRCAATITLLIASALILVTSGCQIEDSYLERDVRDDVFYFVMPDRFENGNLANDTGDTAGDRYATGFDPYDKAWYHGGDMEGLESRLDYLKGLGITAIWMTPILKNQTVQGESSAYHGYWTLDFTQIDPHLGSNENLKSLIDAAHELNMKVYFDIITNHTADVIKFEECHEPDGTALAETCPYVSLAEKEAGNGYHEFLPAGSENLKVPAWLNDPKYYNNQGDSTFSGENSVYGDFFGLDDIDTRQPEVVDGMIEIFENIVTEFKPDGFRIDTVKHVDLEFWQQFSPAILNHAHEQGIPNFFMFGEVYDGNPQYLSEFTTIGKLPSVLDFGVQAAISSVVANNSSSSNLADLFAQDDVYSDADSDASYLMSFAGNHDMGRIGMMILNGQPSALDDELLARSKLANALLFFARGIPVIYYGDEQGFTGDGGDQDARENMFPSLVDTYNDNVLIGTGQTTAVDNFDTEHPLYLAIAEYAELYKAHPALRRGKQVNRYSENDKGLYAFSRIGDDGKEYLVVFNADTESRVLTVKASAPKYRALVDATSGSVNRWYKTDEAGNVTVEVPALGFAIFKANKAMAVSPQSEFTIEGVVEGSAVAGRVELQLNLVEQSSEFSTYTAVFEASFDGGNNYEILATDSTAPYRLFWHTDALADGTDVIVRATLNNGNDELTEQSVSMIIDSRVPETVAVDYENSAAREMLYVSNQNGGIQGPIALTNGKFNFNWHEQDDSQLLVFVSKVDDRFVIDKPVLISRSRVVALSTENAEGNLEASVFVNNVGDIAAVDNDSGNAAVQLPLDINAAAPFGDDVNVRGGLNGWGTDAMTYVGNQTYRLTRVVEKGDIEFKFADSNWSPVNIGGQVSENGLVLGANPGNLIHTIAQTGQYYFYLVSTELEGTPVVLHFIEQDIGPVGETLYVKGNLNGWSNTNPLAYLGENLYQTSIALNPGSYELKLANSDWSWERVISDGVLDYDVAESVVTSGANSQLTVTDAANIEFSYLYDETLTVSTDYVAQPDPGMIVYFQKPTDWNAPNIYFWEAATTTSADWPGQAMTALGDDWYSFEFSEGSTSANLIFNDGAVQTGNLYRDADGCYDLSADTWSATCDIPVQQLTIQFQKPVDWASPINIYHWNSSPENAVDWPGVAMTEPSAGLFSFTFVEGVTAANLIFNDGAGQQTTDLYRDQNGCYQMSVGWQVTCN